MSMLVGLLKYKQFILYLCLSLLIGYLYIDRLKLASDLDSVEFTNKIVTRDLNEAKQTIGRKDYVVNRLLQDLDFARLKSADLESKLVEARRSSQQTKKAIYDHDLKKLAEHKPKLITTRMQSATERLWLEFETLSRAYNESGK